MWELSVLTCTGRPRDVTLVHIDSGLLPVGAQLLCLVADIVDETSLQNVMQAWHTPVKLATGWTVRDRIPVGARFSAPVQTGPGVRPASCTMNNETFSG
jgi:hypothetical protein